MINTYIINYDLISPNRNYNQLYEAINSYKIKNHILESCWLIKSSLSSTEIRDHLIKYIDNDDKLIVIKSSNSGAWKGFSSMISSWLKLNL